MIDLYLWIFYIALIVYAILAYVEKIGADIPRYFFKGELNTGDIIFSRYNNLLGYFMRLYTGNPWTHMGIIHRTGNNIFVMEVADYLKDKGVQYIHLDKWLKLNHNCEIGVMRLKTGEIDSSELVTQFNRLKSRKLSTFGFGWFRYLFNYSYSETLPKKIICTEFTIYLLQQVGVLEKHMNASSFTSQNIIDKNLYFTNGFSYENLQIYRKKLF